LSIGNERPEYQAGQFLLIDPHQFEALQRFVTFFEVLKGRKEPPRAYSLSSAPRESHAAFTVKVSKIIENTNHLFHICGGSGVANRTDCHCEAAAPFAFGGGSGCLMISKSIEIISVAPPGTAWTRSMRPSW
jgi:hypothetical protein